MRHRAGALLPLAEGLFCFADFGPLQVAHFECHLLEGGSYEGKGAEIVCVPVTLQDLGGDVGGINAEMLADIVLDEGRDVGEIAHRAAHLAGFHALCRILEPFQVALHLLVPEGPFEAEGSDVRVYAVGPADAGSILEFHGALPENFQEILDVLEEDGVGLLEKVAVRRVHDVGGGEAVVDPLALFAEAFAHRAGECDHVVAGLLFDLLDAGDAESGLLPYLLHVFRRNHAEFAPCFAGEYLDLEVRPELVFFCPDVPHHLAGIPFYHKPLFSRNALMFFSMRAAGSSHSAAWNFSPVICS